MAPRSTHVQFMRPRSPPSFDIGEISVRAEGDVESFTSYEFWLERPPRYCADVYGRPLGEKVAGAPAPKLPGHSARWKPQRPPGPQDARDGSSSSSAARLNSVRGTRRKNSWSPCRDADRVRLYS